MLTFLRTIKINRLSRPVCCFYVFLDNDSNFGQVYPFWGELVGILRRLSRPMCCLFVWLDTDSNFEQVLYLFWEELVGMLCKSQSCFRVFHYSYLHLYLYSLLFQLCHCVNIYWNWLKEQFCNLVLVHSHAEKSVGGFFLSPEPEVT
jgi:hypothetical protein